MNPFDWVNSINTKTDVDINLISTYNPFIINRALSYFDDTVLLANEMNVRHLLDKDQQYAFLFATVTKRKRFAKWAKKEEDNSVALISEAYHISTREAERASASPTPRSSRRTSGSPPSRSPRSSRR